MPLIAAATLSLLTGLWPLHQPQTKTSSYATPAWHVSVEKDRFTGLSACKLYQGLWARRTVSYAHDAVVFHFSHKLNTTQAWYRLDGGPTKPWADVYPRLVQAGVVLDGQSLDNPTGGLVMLPAAELAGVHTVTIRVNQRSNPRTFEVDGFSDALASAQARGCDTTTSFLR